MKRSIVCLGIGIISLITLGCTGIKKEEASENVVFEMVDTEEIPDEMMKIIREKKEKGFRITYEDDTGIYIGYGYGKQEWNGYQIEVDKCSVSQHFIYIHTCLLGPEKKPPKQISSCPYAVFRVNETRKQVIFLN